MSACRFLACCSDVGLGRVDDDRGLDPLIEQFESKGSDATADIEERARVLGVFADAFAEHSRCSPDATLAVRG